MTSAQELSPAARHEVLGGEARVLSCPFLMGHQPARGRTLGFRWPLRDLWIDTGQSVATGGSNQLRRGFEPRGHASIQKRRRMK
jgi:hypothetical protein